MYITAHFHDLLTSGGVKLSDVNKFVCFQMQYILPFTFMT